MESLSQTFFWIAVFAYLLGAVIGFAASAFPERIRGGAPLALAGLGIAAQAVSLTLRGLAAGHVPWSNMYEYSSTFGLIAAVTLVLAQRRTRWPLLSGAALGGIVVLLGVGYVLYVPPGPLVPALESPWLKIHTTAMVTSSGIFGIAFVAGLLYLWSARLERASVGPGAAVAPALRPFALRLPAPAQLDEFAHKLILVAFPLWTLGTILGGVWGEQAWGRFWGWDPKETWAFITFLIYAAYLHARATHGWRGTRAVTLNTAGFVSLVITFYAVNLWIVGLHSYAR